MAVLGNSYFDLIDLEKSKDPDGGMADVIEMLVELNPMLKDALAVECNNGTSHRHTVRTGLPSVSWGKLYQGIAPGKSTKAQVDDVTGFLEGLSTIDKRVLDLSPNEGAVRLSEANAFLEAIAQEMQETLIYGDITGAPQEFMGFDQRFNSLSAANGNQIVDAGGNSGDNTSIWMVTWAPHACHLIYPKGTKAGVEREDKGEQRVTDSSGNAYYVMEELFRQHCGLCVKDWRYVSRIANIDTSALQAGTVDLYDLLRKAYYRNQGRRMPMGGTVALYMNKDCIEWLDAYSTNSGSADNYVRLGTKEIQGEEVTTWRGMPIRETDAITNTEGTIT